MVEDLEGRQFLSSVVASHIGVVADVQKVREAAVAIQGALSGTNVASPAILFPVFAQ
jgi:hypothetical protein